MLGAWQPFVSHSHSASQRSPFQSKLSRLSFSHHHLRRDWAWVCMHAFMCACVCAQAAGKQPGDTLMMQDELCWDEEQRHLSPSSVKRLQGFCGQGILGDITFCTTHFSVSKLGGWLFPLPTPHLHTHAHPHPQARKTRWA